MPLFEFQCPKCRRIVERLFVNAQQADERGLRCVSRICPGMTRARMERIPSIAGFVLKGPGFHANDYRKP